MDFQLKLEGGGVKGFMERLVSSTGGDLDFVTQIHQDLQPGRVAIRVRVGKDTDARDRVAKQFQAHHGLDVSFLDRRAIEHLG